MTLMFILGIWVGIVAGSFTTILYTTSGGLQFRKRVLSWLIKRFEEE